MWAYGHITPYSRKRSTGLPSCSARLRKMAKTPPIKRNLHQKETRRRNPPLKVYCLETERKAIENNATAAGKSTSEFLRAVGTGYRVESVLDIQLTRELIRLNADQGRLGGLLKLMLTNHERFEGRRGEELRSDTHTLLQQIEVTQEQILNVVKTVLRKPT